MQIAWKLVLAGLFALQDYIIYHTITCLIAAFLLAGAVVSFVSKEAIIYYLGQAAGKVRSFTIAALGSFAVAACSCTVVPVSAGLYYGGGAVGPAFIVLWVAPAANILATMIGAVSYFATMTEAPFVHGLMKLGMGKGPALALMLKGGVLDCRKDGLRMMYSLKTPCILNFLSCVTDVLRKRLQATNVLLQRV